MCCSCTHLFTTWATLCALLAESYRDVVISVAIVAERDPATFHSLLLSIHGSLRWVSLDGGDSSKHVRIISNTDLSQCLIKWFILFKFCLSRWYIYMNKKHLKWSNIAVIVSIVCFKPWSIQTGFNVEK